MTKRRMCLVAATVLGGCLCPGERITRSAYASMASYRSQITACIVEHECERLCAEVLGLGEWAEIESCVITSVDREPPTTLTVARAADDLALVTGVSLSITYVEQVACSADWADDDGSTDDGSTDDGDWGDEDWEDEDSCEDWCDDDWDDDDWEDDDWDDDDWDDDDGGDDDGGDDGGGGDDAGNDVG